MLEFLGVGRVDLVFICAITRRWATRLAILSGINIVPIELHLAPNQLQISSKCPPSGSMAVQIQLQIHYSVCHASVNSASILLQRDPMLTPMWLQLVSLSLELLGATGVL